MYKQGPQIDSHDPRDYMLYSPFMMPQAEKQPVADLRKYVMRIYQQEKSDSCTANALCSAFGLILKKQELTLGQGFVYFNPSRLFLYYNTRKYAKSQDEDNGASLRNSIKALNRRGVCAESDWPYDLTMSHIEPPQCCYRSAKDNNLSKYERLRQDMDQFRACLSEECPFVFGFKLFYSFNNSNNKRHGLMPMPTDEERAKEQKCFHAVVAVGYNDFKGHIIVLNSWGKIWGDGGYFYMPYDFIMDPHFCHDFWKIPFVCEAGRPRPDDRYSIMSDGDFGFGAHKPKVYT